MMHLNTYGLMMNGFKLIAEYRCLKKGERALNIECYSNGKDYLVRTFFTGRTAWDDIYDSASDANKKVQYLLKNYKNSGYGYKRVI